MISMCSKRMYCTLLRQPINQLASLLLSNNHHKSISIDHELSMVNPGFSPQTGIFSLNIPPVPQGIKVAQRFGIPSNLGEARTFCGIRPIAENITVIIRLTSVITIVNS